MKKMRDRTEKIAVLGSIAYDQISSTRGMRKVDTKNSLNLKINAPINRFGGCGANIAVGLSYFGVASTLLSISGKQDDAPYVERLGSKGVPLNGIIRVRGKTSRGFVITDSQGEQFTAFYPGPSIRAKTWERHLLSLQEKLKNVEILICAPFPHTLTRITLAYFKKLKRRPLIIWNPGQYLDQLSQNDIAELSDSWDWFIGNAYEAKFMSRDISEIKTIIITDGEKPITVRNGGTTSRYSFSFKGEIKDPTGCGDAFNAGLIQSLVKLPMRKRVISRKHINQGIKAAQNCITRLGAQL